MSEIDNLKHRVGKRLLTWSIISIIIGLALYFGSPNSILGGIGLQTLIWGVIDAVIALSIVNRQKEQSIEKIAKTVSTSIRFDTIFVIVGIIVILAFFQNPFFMGNGIGVIIQGFFLLLLDTSYLKLLRNSEEEGIS